MTQFRYSRHALHYIQTQAISHEFLSEAQRQCLSRTFFTCEQDKPSAGSRILPQFPDSTSPKHHNAWESPLLELLCHHSHRFSIASSKLRFYPVSRSGLPPWPSRGALRIIHQRSTSNRDFLSNFRGPPITTLNLHDPNQSLW